MSKLKLEVHLTHEELNKLNHGVPAEIGDLDIGNFPMTVVVIPPTHEENSVVAEKTGKEGGS